MTETAPFSSAVVSDCGVRLGKQPINWLAHNQTGEINTRLRWPIRGGLRMGPPAKLVNLPPLHSRLIP